jgi:anaerobic ribonucleoside-triphosphate reductase activating protein
MKIRLAKNVDHNSIVDGEGIRSVIWTQGCSHACPGCHNPDTHSFNGGFLVDLEKINKEISDNKIIDGITFSGGDPMFQISACLEIAKNAKRDKKNVWCYTGFTYEELIVMSKFNKKLDEFLNNIDVLVDGKFEIEKKDLTLRFRGSSNQRIINVKKSLRENRIVIFRKYMIKNNKQNKEYLFV